MLRVINTPRRGIGKTSINSLTDAAQQLGVPLWEILTDETSVNTMAGRAAKSVNGFVQTIVELQGQLETLTAAEILSSVMEISGYVANLKAQGTDEADNRLENILELYNAVQQFQEDNEETSLEAFLSSASLASDLDNLEEGDAKVSLMTLHSAKGLEFPVVFLVGLEQGLLPHSRSLNDPLSLEEERRLCYVGITRAQEQLFLSYARERRLWGSREPAIVSQFLHEIPEELISSNIAASIYRPRSQMQTTITKNNLIQWRIGDRLRHPEFGEGEITHILGSGKKSTLAVKFPSINATKIIAQTAPIEKLG